MSQQPVHTSTFVIERRYPVSTEKVFTAWSSAEAKSRWFAGPDGWQQVERTMDFRAGGRELLKGRFPDGKTSHFEARYHEVVKNQLIVYVYDMYVNDWKMSVSLASIEFLADSKGTRLLVTEQGVFFGSKEDAAGREHGTNWLVDKMGAPFE